MKRKLKLMQGVLRSLGFSPDSINPTKKQGMVTYGLVFAMFGAHKLEKMNEMRDHRNCGTNTLCTYNHEWPLRAAAGMVGLDKMSDDTKSLWIEIEDLEGNGPLYLASPCKADLTVRMSECECNKFYDTSARYSEVVVHEWDVNLRALCLAGGTSVCPTYKIVNTHNIPIDFPVDSGYEYKGPVINFDYFPECEEGKEDTSECKMRIVDLSPGTVMDSPLMLDQALRTMDQGQLNGWIYDNTNPPIRLSSTTNTLQFAQVMPMNYDQGTVYKKCIKGDWWAFWEGSETVPCLKIKGHGYTDYGPNFCYEKKWDSASVAEVSIIAGEVVVGVVAGAVAGFFSGGAGALPAYCVTSVGASAVGAWALAGTMSQDKWPGGINQ